MTRPRIAQVSYLQAVLPVALCQPIRGLVTGGDWGPGPTEPHGFRVNPHGFRLWCLTILVGCTCELLDLMSLTRHHYHDTCE